MRSLRELQIEFVHGVVSGDANAICTAIAAHGIDPHRRFNIYRNNAREGFLKTLSATFPIIARLAGLDWFRQTGMEYMRTHPSTSGNLHYIGSEFPRFLDERLAGTPHSYFADVARLEWAYQEVLVAADHPAFALSALATIAAEEYGSVRFKTHPALRLVASRYPLLAIWHAHKSDERTDTLIDLDAGEARLLVIRRHDHVELRELGVGTYALLAAFMRGHRLEDALDIAVLTDESFDVGRALTELARLGTLADFELNR